MADFALGQQTATVVRCMRKAEVGGGLASVLPAVSCRCLPLLQAETEAARPKRLEQHTCCSRRLPSVDSRSASHVPDRPHRGRASSPLATVAGRSSMEPELAAAAAACITHFALSAHRRPQFNVASKELVVLVKTPSFYSFHPWFRTEH